MAGTNGYSPVQLEILSLLEDGERHSREEIYARCNLAPSSMSTVNVHISNLRKKLPEGEMIICETYRRQAHYRLVQAYVRPLASPYDGRC